jgi:membrane protease YdiL (CAAX protease family)
VFIRTILTAALVALGVLLVGSLPWSGFGPLPGLGLLNLRVFTTAPWAAIPMALYLWVYWRFVSGGWGGVDGALRRRQYLRANALSLRLWGVSLSAGVLGFAALLALLAVAARLLELPASAPITMPASMPLATSLTLIVMQSIVAGVTEEAAFRGYMQSMIEPRYGVMIAILAHGIWFGLLHFSSHPSEVLMMLPYYIGVSAVYGGLTWATNSILPALVLHAVGNVVVLTRWWLTGLPEWQLRATPFPQIRDSGIDRAFVLSLVASLVLTLLTTLSYRALRRLRVTTIGSSSGK